MCFIPNTHFNPNSAKTRIQNHLIYKLGLALILYDKQRKEKLKQLQIPNNNSKGHSIFPNNTLYPNNNQHLITPKDTLSNLKSNQESPNNHNQHPTTLKDTPSPNNNYNQHLITPNNTYASNMWGGGAE